MLLGCCLRLFYFSVRNYGWKKVIWFLSSLTIGLWICNNLFGLSLNIITLCKIMACTLFMLAVEIIGYHTLRYILTYLGCSCRNFIQHTPSTISVQRDASLISHVALHGTSSGLLWNSLISEDTFAKAWDKVHSNAGRPGSDGVTVEAFAIELDKNLHKLKGELQSGKYRPLPVRLIKVPKGNGEFRQLSVLAVKDRVVQQALLQVLTHIWDSIFADCSYAYRPGKSALQAVEQLQKLIKNGNDWIVRADIDSFFDTLSHERLFELLLRWIPDEKVRLLVQLCIQSSAPCSGLGVAQGAPISPILSNLYLTDFDNYMIERGYKLVRYADDFVIPSTTQIMAQKALKDGTGFLNVIHLRLKEEKTQIVHKNESFIFLGFIFSGNLKKPSDDAFKRLDKLLLDTYNEDEKKHVKEGWESYFSKLEHKLWKSEELDIYKKLFVGRDDIFARFWLKDKRHGYLPIKRTITHKDIISHLEGESILGTYLLRPDGTTKSIVFDFDGPSMEEQDIYKTNKMALRLASVIENLNIPSMLFDSGGKGRHLWVCFDSPVKANRARRWANSILNYLHPYQNEVTIEIFPKQDIISFGALGSLIRLPFGFHPITGRVNTLLDRSGNIVANPWEIIAQYRCAKTSLFENDLGYDVCSDIDSGSLYCFSPIQTKIGLKRC